MREATISVQITNGNRFIVSYFAAGSDERAAMRSIVDVARRFDGATGCALVVQVESTVSVYTPEELGRLTKSEIESIVFCR